MSLRKHVKNGFTIVETMISVIFISILLIAIGSVSLHIINTYQRGVMVKMVNETGRTIGEDLRISLASGSVDLKNDYFSTPEYGILCTGGYTYIWNYAQALKTPNSRVIRYEGGSTSDTSGDDKRIRMIKILDRSRSYCVLGRNYDAVKGVIPHPSSVANNGRVIEVIKPSEGDLMVYDFSLTRGSSSAATGQALANLSFSLGTFNQPEVIKAGQCVPDPGLNYASCAINRFDISILTRER